MTTKEQRRKDWSARLKDYRASDLSMVAWCDANQVTKEQLKYWIRKLKVVHLEADGPISPSWVPLKVSDSIQSITPESSLIVRIGSAQIEIRPGFDPRLLREVVQSLEEPC
ncbi:IS66 family insertion sequence element accessory protein TnpA [Paenibacillus ferrarius]|uniref:IS66 family insertion sequence element accessory protein TnpA n=1 Tax=Paenibacillus ferrarius TaxID=1469647 RepID=UPI003D2DF9E7